MYLVERRAWQAPKTHIFGWDRQRFEDESGAERCYCFITVEDVSAFKKKEEKLAVRCEGGSVPLHKSCSLGFVWQFSAADLAFLAL